MAPDHGVHTAPEVTASGAEKKDIAQVERVMSTTTDVLNKDHMNYDRVDAEVAKYANAVQIEISEEEDKRLKRMIDRRVLPIMVITYFLQALDKGTMSFTSIMGILDDIPVLNTKVCCVVTLPFQSTNGVRCAFEGLAD